VTGPAPRAAAPVLDTAARLRALAAAIPAELAGAERIARRVAELGGDAAAVEAALIALDDALLEAAGAALDAEERASLERWVERRLVSLSGRFDAEELARAAARLRSRELRRRAGLPLLSLFSADAEATSEPSGG
jgi:hypothetical protein